MDRENVRTSAEKTAKKSPTSNTSCAIVVFDHRSLIHGRGGAVCSTLAVKGTSPGGGG